MNKQEALVKLATVRLAINYVLRQRMEKQATLEHEEEPSIPQWDNNPYDNGLEYSIEDGNTKYYYRNDKDLRRLDEDPHLATRPGRLSDLDSSTVSPRMIFGPLWNQAMANWEWNRGKPEREWHNQYLNLYKRPDAPPMRNANGEPNPELTTYMDNWRKNNPKPKITPFPQQLYMRRPDGSMY